MLYLGLTGHCVGTIVGKEEISSFPSIIYLCWIEGIEAAMAFCSSFEQIVKRMNLPV
jgi:hypothetical protein